MSLRTSEQIFSTFAQFIFIFMHGEIERNTPGHQIAEGADFRNGTATYRQVQQDYEVRRSYPEAAKINVHASPDHSCYYTRRNSSNIYFMESLTTTTTLARASPQLHGPFQNVSPSRSNPGEFRSAWPLYDPCKGPPFVIDLEDWIRLTIPPQNPAHNNNNHGCPLQNGYSSSNHAKELLHLDERSAEEYFESPCWPICLCASMDVMKESEKLLEQFYPGYKSVFAVI